MSVGWESVAEELVASRYPALVGYAMVLAGSRPDAEDLVHDAPVATFARRRNLSNRTVAEAYVRRSITTTYFDSQRKAGRERAANRRVSGRASSQVAGPEDAVAQRSAVGQALSTLAPQERACIVLRYMDQLSTRETASTLGIAEGSVKRYVSDAAHKLGSALMVELDLEDPEWVAIGSQTEGKA